MHNPHLYPLTFTPVLRDYLWGGRRLETLYGRDLPPGIVAESWEISGHPNAPTVADAGYWAGQALPTILAELGERLTGTRAAWALARGKFPLLVKLLDARQDLSVQVHPDDAYGLAHEGGELGKTEMWYVLHADPGAEMVLGLQPGTTREDFAAALQRATCNTPHADAARLRGLLRRIPVHAGQGVDVPAGTIHALLAGTVVTEIQQNSDTTYRVYDWDRIGADGKPRALHTAKALEVIDFGPAQEAPGASESARGMDRRELVRNRYFVVEEVTLAPGAAFTSATDGSTLEIWGCVVGQAQVEWDGEPVKLPAIRYALLPAALGAFRITAGQPSTCLRVYLPEQ